MSQSFYVIGVKPPDDRWKQMKAIWETCNAAGIAVPDEVEDFFEGETPDETGVTVVLAADWKEEGDDAAVRRIRKMGEFGFEVELAKLPPDIKYLRFTNNW